MSTQVSEQQARQVAEAAREQDWKLPSFGKELFLGNFRLDLIHPQPKLDAAAVEKGEAFLGRLRAFLTEHVDPLEIERDSKIPEAAIDGLKSLGALGMKVPEQYGGLGLSQVYYNKALALAGTWHSSLATLLSAHQSIGVAEPLMLFGSDEQKQKWLPQGGQGPHLRLPAHGARRGLGPRAPGLDGHPDRGRLPAQRPQAVGDQRRDRRHRRRHGPGPEGRRRPQGRHQRVRARLLDRRRDRREPQRLHGPARDRELRDRARGRLRAGGEPDRQGGHGPQDRPLHAQHGPPRAAGDLRRQRQVGDQDRARVVQGARAVGPAGRQARRRRAEDRLHRGDRLRPGGDARRLLPPGRRQEERHPHRGRDRQALRLRERLAGARRPDADPRRPRLRDRAVAQGPRREAGARRGGAARHAHQPHLRGLHGDHAPADRARGGRPAPAGRRRDPRGRRRPLDEGQGRRRRGQVLRQVAARA